MAISNEAGQVIERTNYEPYGAAIGKTVNGIGYTGHVMDAATGLTYMQQRYYDPGIGRFLSVDPVTANASTGANFNRYGYANDNPYRFTDPDGREVAAAYDTRTGILVVNDLDSGRQEIVNAESGGKPFGDAIELGDYDILDHPDPDFLRLESVDSEYGDDTDESGRTEFRLHRPGRTWGCIAVCTSMEWAKIRRTIRNTSTDIVRVKSKSRYPFANKAEKIRRFGRLRVIRTTRPPPKPKQKPREEIPVKPR